MDDEEAPVQAVEREVSEETGYSGDFTAKLLYTFQHGDFKYYNHLVIVPTEFTPSLNWEHRTAEWVEYGDWPSPLHFGFANLLKHAGSKLQRLSQLLKQKRDKIQEFDAPPQSPPAIVQKVNKPATTNVLGQQAITNAYIVIATLYGEARGEGEAGMQAVLNVIMNRANGNFSKAKELVLAPKQFSMWNGVSDPATFAINLGKQVRDNEVGGKDKAMYMKAAGLVDQAMKGTLKDITGGAQYYFNPSIVLPSWAKSMKKTVSIGNHDFYKEVPKLKKKK
jgi:spore germination cell wall hydrolase CwlJ-like protein